MSFEELRHIHFKVEVNETLNEAVSKELTEFVDSIVTPTFEAMKAALENIDTRYRVTVYEGDAE